MGATEKTQEVEVWTVVEPNFVVSEQTDFALRVGFLGWWKRRLLAEYRTLQTVALFRKPLVPRQTSCSVTGETAERWLHSKTDSIIMRLFTCAAPVVKCWQRDVSACQIVTCVFSHQTEAYVMFEFSAINSPFSCMSLNPCGYAAASKGGERVFFLSHKHMTLFS